SIWRIMDRKGPDRVAVADNSARSALSVASGPGIPGGGTVRAYGPHRRPESNVHPVQIPGNLPGLLDADLVDEWPNRPSLRRSHPAYPGAADRSGDDRLR